jgi:hypothetical protein
VPAKAWQEGVHYIQRAFFHREISFDVHVCGRRAFMPEPQGDDRDVHSALPHMHAVECRMMWGETQRLASCGHAVAALWAASCSRAIRAGRVIRACLTGQEITADLARYRCEPRVYAAAARPDLLPRKPLPKPRRRLGPEQIAAARIAGGIRREAKRA